MVTTLPWHSLSVRPFLVLLATLAILPDPAGLEIPVFLWALWDPQRRYCPSDLESLAFQALHGNQACLDIRGHLWGLGNQGLPLDLEGLEVPVGQGDLVASLVAGHLECYCSYMGQEFPEIRGSIIVRIGSTLYWQRRFFLTENKPQKINALKNEHCPISC